MRDTIVNETEKTETLVKLEVYDGSSWISFGNEADNDRLYSVSFDNSIDSSSWTLEARFRNHPDQSSLDPYAKEGFNNLLAQYNKCHLDISKDGGAHWYRMFEGYSSETSPEHKVDKDDTVIYRPIDPSKRLKDRIIPWEHSWTPELSFNNVDAFDAVDDILNAAGFSETINRTISDNPQKTIYGKKPYEPKGMTVWSAIQKIFEETGYNVVYRINDNNTPATLDLAVIDPSYGLATSGRADSSDWNETWISNNFRVFDGLFNRRDLTVDDKNVRTQTTVWYQGSDGKQSVTKTASGSPYVIPTSGGSEHREQILNEPDNSMIDSQIEAERLAELAKDDLKEPSPNVSFDFPFFYPSAQITDIYRMGGAGDYTVDLCVTDISHTIDVDRKIGTTTLSGAADQVIGKRDYWLNKGLDDDEDQRQRGDGSVPAQPDGVGGTTFTGSDTDDLVPDGPFTGSSLTNYKVEIDSTGSPDTFKWSDDGGSTWDATSVGITGSDQSLNNGVTVKFANTTGHTVGDYWEFTGEEFLSLTVSYYQAVGSGETRARVLLDGKEAPEFDILYYKWQYAIYEGGTWSSWKDAGMTGYDQTTRVIEDLPVGASREFKARYAPVDRQSQESGGSASWSPASSTITLDGDATPPAKPNNLTVTGVAGAIDLNWDLPTTDQDGSDLLDLEGIRVYIGTSSHSDLSNYASHKDIGKTTNWTHEVGGNVTKHYRIVAFDNSENKNESNPDPALASADKDATSTAVEVGDGNVPPAPTWPAAKSDAVSSSDYVDKDGQNVCKLFVSWNAPSTPDIVGYTIAIQESGATDWEYYYQSEKDETSYTITGLKLNTDYDVKVQTRDVEQKQDNTSWSTTIYNEFGDYITTAHDTIPPDSPTGVSASSKIGSVEFSWDAASVVDFAYYKVYVYDNSGPTLLNTYNSSSTTFSWYGMSTDTVYATISAVDRSDNESTGNNSSSAKSPRAVVESDVDWSVFDTATDTLDNVDDGSTYGRIKATDISSGHIKLVETKMPNGDSTGVQLDSEGYIVVKNQSGATAISGGKIQTGSITATEANLTNIFAQAISVNSGGYIKSSSFNGTATDPYNHPGNTGWAIESSGDAAFNNVYVGGTLDATTGLLMETRTTDPASPQNGRIWLRTDL